MGDDRNSDFIGIGPVRAFLICEDLPPLKENSDALPNAMEVFLNPESVSFNTGSSWASLSIPGLSHEVHQWSHSLSDQLSFELVWDRIEADQRVRYYHSGVRNILGVDPKVDILRTARVETLFEPHRYKEFLKGLTIPMSPGYPPSRVTLIWPRFLHITGFIRNVDFEFERFAANGRVMSFNADVSMTELRTTFRQRIDATQYFWKPQQGTTAAESDPFSNYEQTINTDTQGSTSEEPRSNNSKPTEVIGA